VLFHHAHVGPAAHAALNCGSALGILLGDNESGSVVIDLGGSVFKRRSSVPRYGIILDHPNALCTFVTPSHQPFQTPLKSMVITSTLSHGNHAALVSASPVEDEAVEPPIGGYSSEKPKDESVTYIEERTGDEITEYAHTSDAAFVARHLRVDLK